jgi:predicted XRE-type DNA-binding protein
MQTLAAGAGVATHASGVAAVVDPEEPPQTNPDIPDKSWTNPFTEGLPLHDLFEEVVTEERDIVIVIDDYHGRRGTGKTVASLQIADGMDQTDEGMTKQKVSLEPEALREAYANQPNRSALVLDEAEFGASNRQAMSKTNQALREVMSMGRVEEKYVVVNAPVKSFIDTDILKLADVWISMVRKGMGLVHLLDWEPYSEQLLTPAQQWLEVTDIPTGTDLRNVYNSLTREKRKRIKGEEGEGFIPRDEHREKLERIEKEAKKEKRDNLVRAILRHPEIKENGVSQRMIGEAVGVSQTTVSNILGDDADD